MLLIGVVRKVKVYEVFVAGAKEGFDLAKMIIPHLVAILGGGDVPEVRRDGRSRDGSVP